MGRGLHKLSAVTVSSRKEPGYYADGGGLYLRVAPGGSKGWIFRFTRARKTRDAGLGPYPTVSLAKAREQAEQCRRLLASGIDPIEARKAERAATNGAAEKARTFEQCAKAYIASHEAGWRNDKHRYQWRATLEHYVYPIFGGLAVGDVKTEHVLKALNPIWTVKPETATRVRGRIEVILNAAKAQGLREGENPAAWRGHLDQLLPPTSKVRRVEHHAALPYRDVPAFMALLRSETGISAKALEFMVLTATRTGETLGARWDEIDLKARMWTIPAHRMKGGRAHRVPLSVRAIAILKEMAEIRQSEFVFPGGKPGRPLSQMACLMLLRRMEYGHVTAHGFRSSFRDWAAEKTSFSREAAEMALAHAIPNAVEAAYRRGDLLEQRRRLAAEWATFCAQR
jgi:integrase